MTPYKFTFSLYGPISIRCWTLSGAYGSTSTKIHTLTYCKHRAKGSSFNAGTEVESPYDMFDLYVFKYYMQTESDSVLVASRVIYFQAYAFGGTPNILFEKIYYLDSSNKLQIYSNKSYTKEYGYIKITPSSGSSSSSNTKFIELEGERPQIRTYSEDNMSNIEYKIDLSTI